MSCCGPPAKSSSCCPPPSKSTSCCPPPQEVPKSAPAGGCCGPKAPTSSVTSGTQNGAAKAPVSCCAPKTAPVSCCGPKVVPVNGAGEVQHDDVKEYYGKTVQNRDELQSSACLVAEDAGTLQVRKLARNIHPEILSKFYGCGSPIPPSLEGSTMLDLGCGSGRDVFIAAQLVGEGGKVYGIDMTDEQLEVARKYNEWQREKFGYKESNVEFRKGLIEDLSSAGIADESIDVVISNCVINLAPSKVPVLAEVVRVLKQGGELFFSDIFADRRIPQELRSNKMLFGECLGGALYLADFRRIMAQVGLGAWGVVEIRRLDMDNPEIERLLGDIKFFSATIRAVKIATDDLDDAPEDYGQTATYKGTIENYTEEFSLDAIRTFKAKESTRVDSTTAAMLQQSRYGSAFEISAKGEHRGAFSLWPHPLPSSSGPWLLSCPDLISGSK